MRLKAIIYDLDGTLIDSGKKNSLPRLERVLAQRGFALTIAQHVELDRSWGEPTVHVLRKLFPTIPHSDVVDITCAWEDMDIQDPLPFVPGALDTFHALVQQGIHKCLLTSRRGVSAKALLRHGGIENHFVSIACHEEEYRKPDPRSFTSALYALAWHKIGKDEVLYVGDTATDLIAGREAGIRTLIVETGPYRTSYAKDYPHPECDIIPSVADLPRWIKENCSEPSPLIPA